ncbi:divergent polysaccharide deacetylase family protein [Paraglaciecola hydrolytica]|uniref:Divergent polysaccharide deacetylase family protein n=1 Tax=Paraglaciecola hydrolytica TaxID=1799789 RepID=A0A135ZZE5_9ALTE|nr:divergent polysaccharide deacetylase family protein [Paraglaciecola hydrolytica]KXI28355.1 hypothetical protein AX660_18490 [Paraglaciecola hydrolytica]
MQHLLLIILVLCLSFKAHAQLAEIALIIDDMGNKDEDAQAFALPAEVTFAILPNKVLSKQFSERAREQSREVILHMPMESIAGIKEEHNSLNANMTTVQMRLLLQQALDTVPYASGVNNHMGSKLTQLDQPMAVMMEFLLQQGLYFVDSRTTSLSKAERIARQTGVMAVKRNVFLDHQADVGHIEMQFNRLVRLAKKHGRAVAIAHPYPQTLEFLHDNLALLEAQGISLVKLGDFIRNDEKHVSQGNQSFGSANTAK